jgi:hypothetical protein
MCRAELPREFVLRVEGTYWRCFLSDDGSVKLISLRSLVGTEDLPVIELSELQKRVKQLLGIVGIANCLVFQQTESLVPKWKRGEKGIG